MLEFFRDKKKTLVNIAIALCYAIFTFFIVYHHEIWTDEAQVWLLVKNLSLFDLFKQLIHEGHPLLFYLLVMPFAKLNFPVISMQVICWIFSIASVFMLLQFSPFSFFIKLSVILSAGFLYAFPVIARSYSIIPFLVFLCAMLYTERKKYPILYACVIFLISQTHYIMLGFSVILFLGFLYENIKDKTFSKKVIIASVIMNCSILYAFIIAFMSTKSNEYINFIFNESFYSIITNVLKNFVIVVLTSVNYTYIPVFLFLYSVIVLLFFVQLFFISRKAFLIAFGAIGFQILIYTFYYPDIMYLTRAFSTYLILIFAFWISYNYSNTNQINKAKVTFSLIFILTIFNGLTLCILDYKNLYSSSKCTAEFIEKNIDKNSILLTDTNPMAQTLLVYLPNNYKIFNVVEDSKLKYSLWNKNTVCRLIRSNWDEYLRIHNYTGKKVYIIQNSKYFVPLGNNNILFIAPKTILDNEQFIIQEYILNKE